MFSLTVVFFEL